MPFRDGTGPFGDGAFTGKGNGMCAVEIQNIGYGLGFGRGRGMRCLMGRGNSNRFRNNFLNQSSTADEKKIIQNQIISLEKELELLKKKVEFLKN